MKAIRYLSVLIVFVLMNVALQAATLSVPSQFPTIQSAVDAAASSDTILVAPGTYTGSGNRDVTFAGKDLVIRSSGGRDATVIDLGGTESDRHRWLLLDGGQTLGTKIEGFTVQAGFAPLDTPTNFYLGGAIFLKSSAATIQNCVFRQNYAQGGGAIALRFDATTVVSSCNFEQNEADYGGAIAIGTMSHGNISNSRMKRNLGRVAGGAMDLNAAYISVANCVLDSNLSNFEGAVKLVAGTLSSFTNCTISDNIGRRGCAFYNIKATLNLTRTLVTFNAGDSTMFCDKAVATNLSCCDVFGNLAGDYVGCIAGQLDLQDNLSVDPRYCGVSDSSFALADNSPCLPAGNSCGGLLGAVGQGCVFSCVDSDGDGFGDPGHVENACHSDNCPEVSNVSQSDIDHDGVGDICDNCPTSYNPEQIDSIDSDGDGKEDPCDNCPHAWNVDQTDSDLDCIGDSCDACPFDNLNDRDYDGHCANVDNCPTIYNPSQVDSDSDGKGDHCDTCGDADGNAWVTVSDVVCIINRIFGGGPNPPTGNMADADCNGAISISDAVYVLRYIFANGPVPCAACP